jgi:hypothetical protein
MALRRMHRQAARIVCAAVRRARTRVQAFAIALLVAVSAAGLASCATKPRSERTGALVWRECGSIECASLSVPLDRAHPDGRKIHLALGRRPADGKRRGVLLANPGGPGGSGLEFLENSGAFSESVRDHFDIVSWIRGASAPVPPSIATDDLDFFYGVDRTNVEASTVRDNVAVAKRFADACRRNGRVCSRSCRREPRSPTWTPSGSRWEYAPSAISASRTAPTSGALYADAYPNRVRAMVLDGAIDPARSFADGTVRQAVGFDRSLEAFLAWCRRQFRLRLRASGNRSPRSTS